MQNGIYGKLIKVKQSPLVQKKKVHFSTMIGNLSCVHGLQKNLRESYLVKRGD